MSLVDGKDPASVGAAAATLSVVEGIAPTYVVAASVAPPLSVAIVPFVGAAAATLSVFDGKEPPSTTATLAEGDDPESDATTEAATDATTGEVADNSADQQEGAGEAEGSVRLPSRRYD